MVRASARSSKPQVRYPRLCGTDALSDLMQMSPHTLPPTRTPRLGRTQSPHSQGGFQMRFLERHSVRRRRCGRGSFGAELGCRSLHGSLWLPWESRVLVGWPGNQEILSSQNCFLSPKQPTYKLAFRTEPLLVEGGRWKVFCDVRKNQGAQKGPDSA